MCRDSAVGLAFPTGGPDVTVGLVARLRGLMDGAACALGTSNEAASRGSFGSTAADSDGWWRTNTRRRPFALPCSIQDQNDTRYGVVDTSVQYGSRSPESAGACALQCRAPNMARRGDGKENQASHATGDFCRNLMSSCLVPSD